jgi:hypothetical protein
MKNHQLRERAVARRTYRRWIRCYFALALGCEGPVVTAMFRPWRWLTPEDINLACAEKCRELLKTRPDWVQEGSRFTRGYGECVIFRPRKIYLHTRWGTGPITGPVIKLYASKKYPHRIAFDSIWMRCQIEAPFWGFSLSLALMVETVAKLLNGRTMIE